MDSSTENDFDYLQGRWRVQHRRLVQRLAGCTQWQAFEGSCSMQTLLGGRANVDDNLLHLPEGSYRAMSLRSFDPVSRRWAVWWLDGRHPHALDTPVVGGFSGTTGTFLADDVFEGRPIRVRFVWRETGSDTPTWEQAFSADGGLTWEVNWTMRFVREAVPA